MRLPPHLAVRDGRLLIGSHDCVALAERFGTPLYVTDGDRILHNYERYANALKAHYPKVRVLYAAKANSNLSILRMLAIAGAGADVFSSGEIELALKAGMKPQDLLFNGSSKSRRDLALAVERGVRISVDSLDELTQLEEMAASANRMVKIAFRVNPALEVPTHPKIATGLRTSKFGIPHEEVVSAYREAMRCPHLEPAGMHCHIGSQILEMAPFAEAARVMLRLAGELKDIGIHLEFIDLGGGLGIPYRREQDPEVGPEDYASAVMPHFLKGIRELGIEPELWVEPGRFIVADSTLLLTRVNSVKHAHANFANVDAGFNLLVRPVMYDAYHEVIAAGKADQPATQVWTIAGPICESGDILARDRRMPELIAGDLLAILDAGAYGFVMSSQYNARPRCAEVLLRGDEARLVRRAETMEDIISTMVV
ncbi:MAG: diaminopimelate decarboxylase [Methanomicrobiales archaeon]|nr:diaminopimelate decarboxylase [Methanomicrobiales archaeon]